MLRCNSGRGCGCCHTRLVTRLTLDGIPIGDSELVNDRVVKSSTHEIVQQASENVLNIEHSFDRLAQITTELCRVRIKRMPIIQTL